MKWAKRRPSPFWDRAASLVKVPQQVSPFAWGRLPRLFRAKDRPRGVRPKISQEALEKVIEREGQKLKATEIWPASRGSARGDRRRARFPRRGKAGLLLRDCAARAQLP